MATPEHVGRWKVARIISEIRLEYEGQGILSDWAKEEEGVVTAVRTIAEALEGRYDYRRVLGVGGSGVVLRLSDDQFPTIDNALKFPRPVAGKVDEVAALLRQEITYLAKLRHRNVVRINDYRFISNVECYGELPFYLMEAIEGASSQDYLRSNSQVESVMRVFSDAAEVVRYLHSTGEGFAHLDLKPSNFVIDSDGHAVMIDLGTCKRLSGAVPDLTMVACTRPFAHPDLIRHLDEDPTDINRAKGKVKRSEIRPVWDLWSLGLTLLSWLGFDPLTGERKHSQVIDGLDAASRKYLFLLAGRLVAGPYLPSWIADEVGLSTSFLQSVRVHNSSEVAELLRRARGASNPLKQVEELSLAQTNTIQAAPGIHVAVTERLRAVLDHRLFRRLNSISQLGLVSQVYPGAKHSRREHSLGTYANVQRMLRVLYDDQSCPLFRQLVTVSDISATLLAALLHDLGQFPLAHDLEEIEQRTFDHSELTEAMISGTWDKKKKGSRKIVFESLDPIFSDWQVPKERVLAILAARPANLEAKPKDKLLRALFNGPVDADKLDYLLRDGRNLDLPYPRGVDVERIFSTLTTVVVDRIESGARDVPVLAVHAKGKVAAEFLTLARYAMFSQAYWHHAVRAQKAMLFRAVEALLTSASSDAKWRELQAEFVEMVASLPEILYEGGGIGPGSLFAERGVEPSAFFLAGRGTDLAATDAAVLSWFFERMSDLNLPEGRLLDRIMRRQFFKRLWVVSREMSPGMWDRLIERWQRLTREQKHRVSHLFERAVAKRLHDHPIPDVTQLKGDSAADRIDRATGGRIPWLLIDMPGHRPGSEVPLYYVVEGQRRALRKDNRSVGEPQSSDIWERYAKNLLEAAGKLRVFCDPELVDSVEAAMDWRTGIGELQAAVDEVAG